MLLSAGFAAAALALGGCSGSSPTAAGASVPGSAAAGAPAPVPSVSLSQAAGTGYKGTLVAHYSGYLLKAGGGISLQPTDPQQQISAGVPYSPQLGFSGDGLTAGDGSDTFFGMGAMSFEACVAESGDSQSDLSVQTPVPSGASFCYSNRGVAPNDQPTTDYISLIKVVGYRTASGAPDPDPSTDATGSVVIDMSTWKATTYPCTGALSQPGSAQAETATYTNVRIPAGDQIVLQPGVRPHPTAECPPAGYDLGYNGNGDFSTDHISLLNLAGSSYQNCQGWFYDVNAGSAKEAAGLKPGGTLCYVGDSEGAIIKIVSADATSVTVDISVSLLNY